MLEEVPEREEALVIRPRGVQMLELICIERPRAQKREAGEVGRRDQERARNGNANPVSTDRVQCARSFGVSGPETGTAVNAERRCDALMRRGRYFTMHHTARAPSRQPIFLPSS
jgi:hypothetical protein